MAKHLNTLRKISLVKTMATKLYEPGNQSRNWYQAWRKVREVYPCRYETFIRWMNTDVTDLHRASNKKCNNTQLTIFDNETN